MSKHVVPWLAARGPGCLVLWDAWRKDRRRGRKDKFRTLYLIVLFVLLDPLFPFLCLWKRTHRDTHQWPQLPFAAEAGQPREGTGSWSDVWCVYFSGSQSARPLYYVCHDIASHKCYHLWVLRISSFREKGGMLVSQGCCNKILQTGRLKKTKFIVS